MDISSRIELKDYIVTDDDDIFVFPASPIQKQIWDLNKLYPDSSVFNKIYGFRIKGKFNYDAYSWALNKIIERHESLRTCFGYRENSLLQIIKTSMTIDIPLFNLSDDDRDKKETKIKQIIETELSNPFNLKTGPLIRSVVVKLAEGEFELFLSTHSIIADQTSLIIFNKELGSYYSRYIAGKYTDVESPRLQYADWVMFNFTEEQQKSHTGKLEYWKNQLNGFQEVLDLNYDTKKPVRWSLRGDVYNFKISKKTSEKIKSIIRKESKIACPFFLSVLNILLYKYSGKQELIVGCPFSNRIYPGTEDIIGCMANTLPVKTVLKEDDTFNSLLKNVKENVQSAKKNQEVPFEKIMESLGVDFNPGNSPIYQVNFIYGNSAIVPEFEDLQIESLHLHNLSSQYDISLHIWESDEVFSGYIEYATDLFEKATVARMLGHYVNILETGLENPDVKINNINILTQEELTLYAHLNETSVTFPSEKCIHSLFEEQAFRTPDAIALQYELQKLTYVQLNEQANCFANFLIKKGVNVGDFVGVNIERCLEIPVVLLGILKAGAAYIPLDPGFPTERLNYMVEDAKIKYLVTTSSNKEIFKSGNQIEYILLDKEISNIYKHYDNHNINKKYSSENLAYILFTSGSTGKPKGVKIQHNAFVNFINSMAKTPGINRNDILLSVTTLSFDIAGLEIFLPLLNGARTVILPKDVVMDAELLAESISKYSATIMQATPVTWKLLLEFGWQPKSLLKILCGGEALSSSLAGKLSKLNCELWNMYGPTETCVWSSVKKILPDDAFVSIGRPIDNTTFYILDKYLNMVPVGIPGELYIGGIGLSSGYLNRPELTRAMFIKNPFSSEPDSKIYKTGDLAKSHPDGNVECLGRVDYQVKIRGFRVEIGEIEKQLVKINNIKEAVVVSVSEDCGLNQLVAYIITDNGNIDISGIRKNLNEFLPDYMIPSTFNLISSFPLTPNGKIDRKALIAMPAMANVSSGEYTAAENVLEYQLIKIWESVLQKKPIGVTDNFFELGGHSLLAARLFSKIYETTNIKVPLAVLFQAPTIKELASVIKRDKHNQQWSPIVPINPEGEKPPLFLIHGAEGNVLLYRDLAKYLGNEQPVYGIQSQGLNGIEKFNPDFENVAQFYKEEIKRIQPEGPYLLGGYCLGGTIALEIAQQFAKEKQKVALLAMFETYNLKYEKDILKFSNEIIRKIQNLYFHAYNFFHVDSKNRSVFFRHKWETAKFRLKVRVNNLFGTLFFDPKIKEKYPHLLVQKLNDKAEENYHPKKYHDEIILYKPNKDFAGMKDYYYGWHDIADVKVCTLPISPKGMLVEPFVQTLAMDLKNTIDMRLKSYKQTGNH